MTTTSAGTYPQRLIPTPAGTNLLAELLDAARTTTTHFAAVAGSPARTRRPDPAFPTLADLATAEGSLSHHVVGDSPENNPDAVRLGARYQFTTRDGQHGHVEAWVTDEQEPHVHEVTSAACPTRRTDPYGSYTAVTL